MKNEPHLSAVVGAILAAYALFFLAGSWSFVVGAAVVMQAMTVYVVNRNQYRSRNGDLWFPVELFGLFILVLHVAVTHKSLWRYAAPVTLYDILGIVSAILLGLWFIFTVCLLKEQRED